MVNDGAQSLRTQRPTRVCIGVFSIKNKYLTSARYPIFPFSQKKPGIDSLKTIVKKLSVQNLGEHLSKHAQTQSPSLVDEGRHLHVEAGNFSDNPRKSCLYSFYILLKYLHTSQISPCNSLNIYSCPLIFHYISCFSLYIFLSYLFPSNITSIFLYFFPNISLDILVPPHITLGQVQFCILLCECTVTDKSLRLSDTEGCNSKN